MTARRSNSDQRRKVEEARRVVRQARGDAARHDRPPPEKYVPVARPTESEPVKSEAIGVLFPGEVAVKLGISRDEVERMIAAGKMRALVAGFSLMVPTSEVERFKHGQSPEAGV